MSTKITRPGISGVIHRKRLFGILANRIEKPILWISSPAGSGKTKLISSFLDFHNLPCIWYQCDEGDSDVASFFHYMRLAAQKVSSRSRQVLPPLNPECFAGINAFARQYFEQLYGCLASRRKNRDFFIVLDNYQDVSDSSQFHEMIAGGFDSIPEGVRVIVISRSDPPAALARLQANDKISLVGYSDVRFTFEESKELLHRRIPDLDDVFINTIYERTNGWAAGIILMLERARLQVLESDDASELAYERIFDYFAGEIFDKTPCDIQDFLLVTAFLPVLSVSLVKALTGINHAGRILATLNRHNYFTDRLSGNGQGCKYHPLFREFLLNRARVNLSPDALAAVQRQAAKLLEQSGLVEDAVKLYRDAGDRQSIARMVIRHAGELLKQVRNRTLNEWIAAIPVETVDRDPWLLFWSGRCAFPFDMPRARILLEKAFELFKANNDLSGLYLSWAGIVDTYGFELDDWKHLDSCIEAFECLRKTRPSFPTREIDLMASSRMLFCLILRKTDHPRLIMRWLKRVSSLLQETSSDDVQLDILFFVSLYNLWKGEYQRNTILLDEAEVRLLQQRSSLFAVIYIKMMKGIHYWVTAQYGSALKTLSEGLDIANQSGVHVFDSLLWSFQVAAQTASGNTEEARRSLKKQMTTALENGKTLDVFFYHINSAWHALLEGETSLASENMEAIAAKAVKIGAPYYRALWHIGMAQVTFRRRRIRDAEDHIAEAHRISLDMKSWILEWYSQLIGAWMFLQMGKDKEGLASLTRALSLGRRHGYVHLEFYQPDIIRYLLARGLKANIEAEYIRSLIRKLGLPPPAPSEAAVWGFDLEDWPYPIRIFTLGRFEIFKDNEPLMDTRKVQKKPLEMLKIAISEGGTNVPVESLVDALWPDADGYLGQKSFEVTLSRLRRLLGGDAFVRYSAGQLSIDPLYCRVDSLVLEDLIKEILKSSGDRLSALCRKAVNLYQGPFLPSDAALPSTARRREMLRAGLQRIVSMSGRHFEDAKDWERAADLYSRGLDIEPQGEEFYQRLMICYWKLGNNSGAVKTYNRCRRTLHEHLGIDPSSETEAIYASILRK